MNNFKEYLEEGVNDYFLYHGTSLSAGLRILASNEILGNTGQAASKLHGADKAKRASYANMYEGISLTRDLYFAKEWATVNSNGNVVIFKLNHRSLKQKYRILPFNYYPNWRHEMEEFLIGNVKPLNRYCISVLTNEEENIVELNKYNKHNLNIEVLKI